MDAIDNEALQRARSLVAQDLGSITDLPTEIQNTIANLYYKMAQFLVNYQPGGNIPASVFKSGNVVKDLRGFGEEQANWIAGRKHLPGIISALRKVRDHESREEFENLALIILCMFKYGIPNALDKSVIRLKIEKRLRQAKVDEIENLYQMIL